MTPAQSGGGQGNAASNNYSTVGGGGHNAASGGASTVGGGYRDTSKAVYGGVFSGYSNLAGDEATDTAAFVGGGYENSVTAKYATVGGGYENLVEGDYSAILGGRADTITATADYSYLFGIKSKLTEDSTFMVDMPHIRFGDETNGYEFPTSDGANNQVMATDGSGQLSWVDVSGGGGWVDDGTMVRLETSTDNVGIGTNSPTGKLHVETDKTYAGYFRSDSLSDNTHVLHSEFTGTGNYDAVAVYGKSCPADHWGFGGYFEGGHYGVFAQVLPTGGCVYCGVRGAVAGGSGNNYGVYGYASGGSLNYGVYYSGGLAGTGTKSCVVKTSKGPTLLYCQESPENWFEDFGEGQLINGRTRIELDPLFLETVTIDGTNPMKVFVQLEGDCNGVYVSKGTTSFDVVELKGGTSNVPFSYRVVAKRKGFEDRRLDYTAAGKDDPYLYPEAAARLEKEREKGKME